MAKPVASTYRSYSVINLPELPELPVSSNGSSATYYHEKNKPVFFRHYWFQGDPELYNGNVCCLDYSVAKKGKLVAYRWDGARVLSLKNLEYVNVLN